MNIQPNSLLHPIIHVGSVPITPQQVTQTHNNLNPNVSNHFDEF